MAHDVEPPPNGYNRAEAAEARGSAVSWAAVIAGAVIASAFTIALVALGAAIGLSSASPWSRANPSAETLGVLAAAWLLAVQLFASGIGGYIAGRLRTRWVRVHIDEVFFRDTAHGLLVWAVGGVITALLLTSAASSIASGLARGAAGAAGQAVASATEAADQSTGRATSNPANAVAYFTDMLFRSDHPGAAGDSTESRAEMNRIFARALASDDLPAADKAYAAQVVARQTGLSPTDAEKRVADVLDQAKSAEARAAEMAKKAGEVARKAGIYAAMWAFTSLLVGAFSASFMAALGGQHRDEQPTTSSETTPVSSRRGAQPSGATL